jgi:DNA-binding transcriptional regulator YhcF (GntR family)
VKALRDEGLVYTVPRRGTYVAEQSTASTEQADRKRWILSRHVLQIAKGDEVMADYTQVLT